jgi:hypothetical protein
MSQTVTKAGWMRSTAKVLGYGRGVLSTAFVVAVAGHLLACSSGGGTGSTGSDGGDGAGCAFVDQLWTNGVPLGLGSMQYWFGSNGCFDSKYCGMDNGGNTYCEETTGTWTQTGCSTVETVPCNGAMDTITIQGPGAQGLMIVDSAQSNNSGSYMPGGTTAPAACALTGVFGAPAWSGTETVKSTCGTKMHTSMQSVSDLSFQQTTSGFSFTDNQGCTLDFVQSAGMATLAAPVTCDLMTDAGTASLAVSSATLNTCGGHTLSGTLDGTETEGTTQCQFTATLTLHR